MPGTIVGQIQSVEAVVIQGISSFKGPQATSASPRAAGGGQVTPPPADTFQAALPPYQEGELLVRLMPGANLAGDTLADQYAAHVKADLTPPTMDRPASVDGKLLLLQLPEGVSAPEMQQIMSHDPRVSYAELNQIYYLPQGEESSQDPSGGMLLADAQPKALAQKIPNDLSANLWGMHNTGQSNGTANADINAPEAWNLSVGRSDGAPTAVIDTGVDYRHEDLAANMWVNSGEIPGDGIDNDGDGYVDNIYGINAYDGTGDPMDGHSHGTHVAGTIAAVGDNGKGVVGVNHKARIMAIKIFNDKGQTNSAAIIRGINFATSHGARVTNNSWGGGAFSQAIMDAFTACPALHIMAAGNESTDNDATPHYPSSYDLANNIAVAASDRNDRMARFSCYGATSVDIAAPGKDIYSTVPGGGYAYKSGTSMASPAVAGVATLVAAEHPEYTTEQLKQAVLQGADRLDNWKSLVVEGRRLNAYGALTYSSGGHLAAANNN